jgi:hypothetical protein
MGPAAPMVDGADEAPTKESSLPAGADDTEVDDDIDDENLDADTTTTHRFAFAT